MSIITPYISDGVYSFNWISLRAPVQLSYNKIENITEPGVAGTVYKWRGYSGDPYVLTPIADLTNATEVAARKIAYSNACGSLLIIGDGLGNVWYNNRLRTAETIMERVVRSSVGGLQAGAIIFQMRLTFEPNATWYAI